MVFIIFYVLQVINYMLTLSEGHPTAVATSPLSPTSLEGSMHGSTGCVGVCSPDDSNERPPTLHVPHYVHI